MNNDNIFDFISTLPEVVDIIGYGSGVKNQEGYTDDIKRQIDLILTVNDIYEFHKLNFKKYPNIYSNIGIKLIKHVNSIGTDINYVSNIDYKNNTYKIGVINKNDLSKDLITWDNMYMAGRCQKPISTLKIRDKVKNEIIYKLAEQIKNIDIEKYFNFEQLAQYAKGAINIVTSIFDIFVSVIVSVYILLERDQIIRFLKSLTKRLFKERTYNIIVNYFDQTNNIFFHFISSQLLDGIIVGIITSIAMQIMGVKYAILLGFMIGLFNLIPYFGAIIAVIIAAIITIFTGGFNQAIWMVIVVTILQQIDANIINPKITGNSLKISPLLVIFAVTVGGAYFGVLGMFLAVPIIAVLKLLIEDYIKSGEKQI